MSDAIKTELESLKQKFLTELKAFEERVKQFIDPADTAAHDAVTTAANDAAAVVSEHVDTTTDAVIAAAPAPAPANVGPNLSVAGVTMNAGVHLDENGRGIPGESDAAGRIIPSGKGENAVGQVTAVHDPLAQSKEDQAVQTNAEAPSEQETAETLDAASKP